MTTDDTKRIPRFGTRTHRTREEAEEMEAAAAAEADDQDGPVINKPHRAWWHRHLDSEERQRVMTELGIRKREHWGFRFTTMLTLSIIVAVMGLSADSAAVVIGAMLLAPLMQPVLAAAACIAMALFRKSLRWMLITIAASVWGIVLSYVLAALFHNGDLPNEVTSRTAPDIRDLVVALGAGVAGAYATVRKDASASLPGVAVAVALVPPLGAVGISMEAGESTFAQGALLLYVTNLIAIVFAGTIVFIITGFVPPRRLANTAFRTAMVGAVVTAIVIAIAIPLYRASTTAVERSEEQLRATEIVDAWLGPVDRRGTPSISFNEDRISVVVRSFDAPIDSQPLTEALQLEFGPETRVSTEWEQVSPAETTTTLAPTTTLPSDEEVLYAQVETIVAEWLADGDPDDPTVASRRVDLLVIDGDDIRLDASGVGAAPPLQALTERLDAALPQTFAVDLTWLERQTVSDEPETTPEEITLRSIDVRARTWADTNGVVIIDVSYDGTDAVIDVAGPEIPDATVLVDTVEDLIGEDGTVTVLFVEQLDITTTTTTTTTTTVAPPTTTAP